MGWCGCLAPTPRSLVPFSLSLSLSLSFSPRLIREEQTNVSANGYPPPRSSSSLTGTRPLTVVTIANRVRSSRSPGAV
ncbi:hypothetical protein IE53DRAFT_275357 [Violaceomyces palustris]|uniref:Uncharacterized protein n=1 Tax=Violaceomyces palustris TaxID=1673888 RepID=A0ACD0NMI9_9BASI|nr:hypothetical protein IE53DRAFT_275357 [Violaceomyces palustris]